MIKKHISMNLLIILCFSMILVSPKLTKATNSTIKIGALGPLANAYGADMKRGSELAVLEINGAGGFKVGDTQYDFDLILENTLGAKGISDVTVTAKSLNKLLVIDNVVAALGGFSSETVLGAIQPAINTSMVPFLGIGSTASIITEYYYRVGPVNGTTLFLNLVSFYLDEMATKGPIDVVVVREDSSWTIVASAGLRAWLQDGEDFGSGNFTFGTDVLISFGATESEIATSLNNITSNTKALLTLFGTPVGKSVTEQWSATGLSNTTYLTGINIEALKNSYFVDTDGAAAGEIYIDFAPPGHYLSVMSEGFIDAYFSAYGMLPSYFAYTAYDSVYIIKEAIQRANSFISADIHEELPNTDYLGTSGRIRFTSEPSAGQLLLESPAYSVFNNTIVHDLFTTSTIGVNGHPYPQVYFSQWNQDGFRSPVWGVSNLTKIIAPPYNPTSKNQIITITTVEQIGTSTGSETETETDTPVIVTETRTIPSFYLLMVLFSTITITKYLSIIRGVRTYDK